MMTWNVAPIYPVGDESVHIFPLDGKEHQTDPSEHFEKLEEFTAAQINFVRARKWSGAAHPAGD